VTAELVGGSARENAASAADAPAGRSWDRARIRSLAGRAVLLLPVLLTLRLGVLHARRPQLWRDELASWSAAERSTGQLLAMLHHVDAVSGCYYLLLHGWVSLFGDSPPVLRLPSALAMAAAAGFVTLTGRKQFGPVTGLVAGLLFAVLPSVSRFAQEARSYAFAVLAVAASTWLLLRALERPTVARWAGYAVAVAAAGLFHMVALCVLVPQAVVVLMRWWRERRRALLLGYPAAVLAGLLPVVPLVVLGRRQVGRQISWLQPPHLQDFVNLWHGLFQSPLVSGCVLAAAALPAAWPRGRRAALEIGLVAALPIVAVWYLSQGDTAYFLDRYLLFTVPAWAVLAGAGLAALRPHWLVVAGLVGTAWLGLEDQQNIRKPIAHVWADERGAARIVAHGYRPGDAIVPARGKEAFQMIDLAMRYYLPRPVRPDDVLAVRTAVQRADLFAAECPQPADCLRRTDRVWVVGFGPREDPLRDLPPDTAAALGPPGFTEVSVDQVQGLTVTLLERADPTTGPQGRP
jgi:mannosyltransferase